MVDLTKEHKEIEREEEKERKRIEEHHEFWDEVTKDMENAIFNHMEDLVGESLRGDYPNFKLDIYPPRIENGKIDVNLLCVLVMITEKGGVMDTISPEYRMVYHVKKKKLEAPRKSECLWRVSYSPEKDTLRKMLAKVITPSRAEDFKKSRKAMEDAGHE